MELLLLWGIGLIAFGVVLFAMELFVPSAGALGVTAVLCMIAGCIAFWLESWVWGAISTAAVLVFVPLGFSFGLRVLPYTPVGKNLILGGDDEEEARRFEREAARRETEEAQQALVGARGAALTDLRPVGTAEIEGARIQVLAEGGLIDKGRPVRVTSVEGTVVKVREAS